MNLHALQLYRALLRASRKLPSLHRQQHVALKVSNESSIRLEALEHGAGSKKSLQCAMQARHEFERNRHCSDQEQVDFLLNLGELQLENCLEQAKHLSALQAAGHLRT